jgi:hypothetical protein
MKTVKTEITERNTVYQKCPVCGKHYLDLRLHVWSSHLDAQEKKGVLDPKKDYSKLLKFIPHQKNQKKK